jgi:predicted RNase H-like nuclease (RuvC/YqgF family)
MWKSIKRLLIYLNLMAEKATETDAFNEAQIEAGIRAQKDKASKAHYANGQLAGQVALLKDQVRRQSAKADEVRGLLQAAANANDEANGAQYAEELSNIEQELGDNQTQLKMLQDTYSQNTEIIANSLREIQKFQRDFERLKTQVAMGASMKNLAQMMQSSITELQGMGGEMNKSMEQLRQSAAGGMGQMTATMDLAKAMGSDVQRQQEARKARGKLLFEQFKAKANQVNAEAATTTPAATAAAKAPERQKIAE